MRGHDLVAAWLLCMSAAACSNDVRREDGDDGSVSGGVVHGSSGTGNTSGTVGTTGVGGAGGAPVTDAVSSASTSMDDPPGLGPEEVVTDAVSSPQFIALSGDDIYVTDPGSQALVRAAKDGSGYAPVAYDQEGAFAIAAAGGKVAWSTGHHGDGEVHLLDTATGEQSTVLAGLHDPYAIAFVGDAIVCSDLGGSVVKRANPDHTVDDLSPGGAFSTGVASDGTNLFVAMSDSETHGHLKRIAADGTVTSLGMTEGYPSVMALFGDDLYMRYGETGIADVPLGGGTWKTFAEQQHNVVSIAADDQYVYWSRTPIPSSHRRWARFAGRRAMAATTRAASLLPSSSEGWPWTTTPSTGSTGRPPVRARCIVASS